MGPNVRMNSWLFRAKKLSHSNQEDYHCTIQPSYSEAS